MAQVIIQPSFTDAYPPFGYLHVMGVLASECSEHYPYAQWAAVTSHSSLTREAPQEGPELKWSETIQGQASLLASLPPTILVPLF